MIKKLIILLLLVSLLVVPLVGGQTNYADIPLDWGGYDVYGDIRFTSVNPPSANQITAYDTDVYRTLGEGSIQIAVYTAGSENTAREADTGGIIVNPGDTVTFSCWMKTADGTSNARIGVDFYSSLTRITGKQSTGNSFYPTENDTLVIANRVSSTDWEQRTIEFTVPTQLTADGYGGHVLGTVHTPTAMIAWVQGEVSDGCTVWFTEASLTIVRGSATFQPDNPQPLNTLYLLIGVGGMVLVGYGAVTAKKGRS